MTRTELTRFVVGAAMLPALLGGCVNASRPDSAAPPAPVTVTPQFSRESGFATLLDRCPISDAGAVAPAFAPALVPLIASLAPIAAQFAVGAVADHLSRLETERDATYPAAGIGEVPASGHACLVIMRGHVGAPAHAEWTQGSMSAANTRSTGLAGPPAFYMEARLQVVPDPQRGDGQAGGGELVLRPQFVHFARSAALRDRDAAKSIGLMIALRPTAAARNATEQTASQGAEAVFTLNLGRMTAGTEVRPTDFTPREAPQPAAHPLADLAQRATLPRVPARLNIVTFVTETADPNRLLRLLNTAVADHKGGIETALSEAIQKAIRDAAGTQPRT